MKAVTLNIKKFFGNNVHIIVSFLIPVIVLGISYAVIGVGPLGTKTVLISDMEGQYIDFYSTLYEILKSKGGLFYSFKAGMGHNFIGIYAYYLSSPFSFLILFFKKQNLTEALYLITLLKIGAAGMTFSIYLKYLYGRLSVFAISFCSIYALMAYCIVYSFNIMWLDGVILLPIVLLGVEGIIKENKFILFTISLIITFIANFYISYMVGLFSFLYFIAGYFSKYSFEIKCFIRKLMIFILSALLAAGSAAFLMVPTFFALKNGMDTPKISASGWGVNFKLFDLLGKLPMGAYDTLTYGLPNIYCGLLTLLMASLFFANMKVGFKEKAAYFFLIAFLVLSFVFYNLNIMWHGFDAPNWFPYRQSFLFSFLLINLSVKCFNVLDGLKIKMILITYGIWLFILILIGKFNYPYLSDRILMVNIMLLSIYAILLCILISTGNKRKFIFLILLSFVLFESFINTRYLMSGLDREFRYASKEKYNKSLTVLSNLVDKIKEKDKNFYRIDRAGGVGRSFNDSMNLGYNGITHFSSMMNGGLNNFLNRLGFITPVTHAVDYSGATLITDSLLGVKYILSDKVRGFGYEEILREGNIKVYENIYALPIGFTVDNRLLNLKAEGSNPFELQNEILNLLMGNENSSYISYFSPLTVEELRLNNVTFSSIDGKQEFKKIDNSKEAFVELIIENPKDQQVYGYLPHHNYSLIDVYVNDSFLESYLHFYNNTILDLGYHHKNERLKLKLILREDSFTILNQYFYGLDGTRFDRAIKKLKYGALEVSEAGDTFIRGSVKANEGGLLFTSIPYDPGWEAIIDGNNAKIKKIGGAFIAVELPKGQHEVVFNFLPQGFRLGIIISGLSLLVIVPIFCLWTKS